MIAIGLSPAPVTLAQMQSKVVFHRFLDGYGAGASHIFIMDANGGNEIQLTHHSTRRHLNPVFCGVGKIAYASDADSTEMVPKLDIYVMSLDGSTRVNLTAGLDKSNESEPHCLPPKTPLGQTQIVFRSDYRFDHLQGPTTGDADIWKVNIDGTGLEQLTDHPFTDENPQWCGGKIIFTRDETGLESCGITPLGFPRNAGRDFQLYLMKPEGELCPQCEPARALTCTPYAPPGASCTPSDLDSVNFYWPTCYSDGAGGQKIAFSAYKAAFYAAREIFRMPLCANGCCADHPDDLFQLTSTHTAVEDDYPSWTPGGTAINFASNRTHPLESTTSDWEVWQVDEFAFEPAESVTNNTSDDADPHAGEVRP